MGVSNITFLIYNYTQYRAYFSDNALSDWLSTSSDEYVKYVHGDNKITINHAGESVAFGWIYEKNVRLP